jgi:hypothetical protein
VWCVGWSRAIQPSHRVGAVVAVVVVVAAVRAWSHAVQPSSWVVAAAVVGSIKIVLKIVLEIGIGGVKIVLKIAFRGDAQLKKKENKTLHREAGLLGEVR